MLALTVPELRLALVGLGAISRFYRAGIDATPGVRLAAICDPNPVRLAATPGDEVRRYANHLELLAGCDVDAVIVTTPNDTHATIGRDVLAAGLPLCVEKPLAVRLSDGADLCDLAARYRVPLFTAFHRRYNTAMIRLCRQLRGRPIRQVVVRYFERIEEHVGPDAWYLDPRRCGGGCLADNGPNAFDLIRQVLGDSSVCAATLEYDAAGIERRATVRLRADGGVPALVQLDWGYAGEHKTVRVTLVDGTKLDADLLAGHEGFKASLWHEYAGVVADFAGHVRAGFDERFGDAGLGALTLVTQAYGSAVTKPNATGESNGSTGRSQADRGRRTGQGAGASAS